MRFRRPHCCCGLFLVLALVVLAVLACYLTGPWWR